MKKYFSILASALLSTGCGQKTDIASFGPEEPYDLSTPVIVREQESGTFTVSARSDPGTIFQNGTANEAVFEFIAKGEWSFAAAAGMLGPGGADAEAGPNYILPGARSFALVARRDHGTIEFVADRYRVALKPHESILFSMNEVSGSFGDNRGSLNVSWIRH